MDDEFREVSLTDRAVTRPEIRLYNTDHQLAPLTQAELEIFNLQFPTLLAAPTSITRKIQLQRVEAYIMAIRAVKQQLNGVGFRGLHPSDTEMGFQPIRPQFVHDPDTATYRVNWQEPLTAATWTAFIGTSQSAGYKVGDDFGLVVTHATSLVTPSPFVSELQTKVGRSDLVPIPLRDIILGDNENGIAVYPLPTLLLPPKETFFMQLLADVTGTEDLQLGGLVIGLGRVLKETAASWS